MFKLFLFFSCLAASVCLAQLPKNKLSNRKVSCKITKSTMTGPAPARFPLNNNLIKPDAGCSYIKGEKIIIKGQVIDQNCVPVSDAKIYLWQTGNKGKYSYKYKKNHLDKNVSFFKGAGSTISNNKGEFYFITIKPQTNKSPPNVNLRVEHPKLKSISTKVILDPAKVEYCNIDSKTNSNTILSRQPIYGLKIVMKGKTFKSY